jgi:iron complex transport system substrate-binding protein
MNGPRRALAICGLIGLFVFQGVLRLSGVSELQQVPRVQDKSPSPARIVSLVPSVTELLFAIGAGAQVVGVSSYDHEPPAVEKLPRVGALVDPDLERLLALRPDLVVTYHSQSDLEQQLARAGVRTFPYAHGGIKELFTTIEQVGAMSGHRQEAAALMSSLEAKLAGIAARSAGKARPRVLLVFGREPLSLRGMYASGGIGFLHDLVELAGGEDVFGDIKRESVQATAELVLARRPDVILEIRADPVEPAEVTQEVAAWNSLASVPAVRNHRVTFLTGSELVTPGPRLAAAAERIFTAIQQ